MELLRWPIRGFVRAIGERCHALPFRGAQKAPRRAIAAELLEDLAKRRRRAVRLRLPAKARQTIDLDRIGDFGQRFGAGGR